MAAELSPGQLIITRMQPAYKTLPKDTFPLAENAKISASVNILNLIHAFPIPCPIVIQYSILQY